MKHTYLYKQYPKLLLIVLLAVIAVMAGACTSTGTTGSGEESGVELTLDETYDHIRNGARLILTHDADSNSFNGFVENTTNDTLKRVRVEVHLSNGVELGPTTPVDLAPGESKPVRLLAKNSEFDTWTAHPEVGGSSGENGHGEGENILGEGGEGEHSEGSPE